MVSSVANLKSTLGPGARASKYKILLSFPTGGGASAQDSQKVDLLCKSASFPSVTVGRIEVWTQGRKQIIPGETEFDNSWTLTFYQEQGHDLRSRFLDWMKNMDDWFKNKHTCTPQDWMVDASIVQMGCGDNNSYQDNAAGTATYKFYDLFPTEVTAVDVDDERINTLQEFQVTFAYTSWEKVEG